ncbi:MAG: hypothetical protein ABSC63_13645 [Candidatus Binataceae bacterium]
MKKAVAIGTMVGMLAMPMIAHAKDAAHQCTEQTSNFEIVAQERDNGWSMETAEKQMHDLVVRNGAPADVVQFVDSQIVWIYNHRDQSPAQVRAYFYDNCIETLTGSK